MEPSAMGKTLVTARLENLDDLVGVRKDALTPDQVRGVEVANALVDAGATGLLVPSRFVAQLGLDPVCQRTSRTIAGEVPLPVYCAARQTIPRGSDSWAIRSIKAGR
jgi:hypothetical protein